MEKAGKGDCIGKVIIPITSLMDQQQHEQWYPLVRADAKRYVAGEVHLKMEYKPQDALLLVQVAAAKNLAPKGKGRTSNPYIKIHLDKKKRKTKTIQKTLQPTFNDLFEFKFKNDESKDSKELLLVVWHRDKINSVFMGKLSIPFTKLEPNFLYDGWYMVTDDDSSLQNVDQSSSSSLPSSSNPLSLSDPEFSEKSDSVKSIKLNESAPSIPSGKVLSSNNLLAPSKNEQQ